MPETKRPLKVFLCHAHADREPVRALYNRLISNGVDAWFDKAKLLPGQDWELEIRKAVRETDVVIVCLSRQFNQAGFRQKEVRLALDTAMEKPEGEIFIIPARLEECDNLESLRKWHWVDLFEDNGYKILLYALGLQLNEVSSGDEQYVQELMARERLETEVQLTRQIQQVVMPVSLPECPGWQIAAHWVTTSRIGGDFYDVFWLSDHKIGIFVSDVADMGMPAALFALITRTLLRAAISVTDSPSDTLRRVNEWLLPDTQYGIFVTAIYGVLDTEQNVFTYANAGLNPSFLVRSNQEIEKLTRTGFALGVAEQPTMNERAITMEQGDVLFFYTDGVTDAFSSDGELFGEDRLKDAIRSDNLLSAKDMLSAVNVDLDEFLGTTPVLDDIVMIAVKRTK